MSDTNGKTKMKFVYTVIEAEGRKTVWIRIGTAFVNRDDSLTVLLDALPINRRLHIRDPREKEDDM